MLADFIAWFEKLQPTTASLIGSLVGSLFALLILLIGAYVNYRLNLRKDERQRRIEANAVAAALYSEILLLSEEIASAGKAAAYISRRTSLKQFDHLYVEEYPISEPTLFNALASKLGMLPPAEVRAITAFYSNVKSMRHWMPRMGEDEKRQYEYSVIYILDPLRDAFLTIAPALTSIEKRLAIRPPAQLPDIKLVINQIEEEKLAFEQQQIEQQE